MTTWFIYLIQSEANGRTYVGSTTDPARRLRQHNGEIRGGARSTSKCRPWKMICYISGFENRSIACRWERIVKCRARGFTARAGAMHSLIAGICPKGRHYYEVPSGLTHTAFDSTSDRMLITEGPRPSARSGRSRKGRGSVSRKVPRMSSETNQ